MPITEQEALFLKRRIERYKYAAIADDWKGGGDPADIPEIERELREAKADLYAMINRLEHNK